MGKTMPRYQLKAMRVLVERLLTVVTRWEDQHADPDDYRMRSLSGGLHQASQSMKDLISGEFNPLRCGADRVERVEQGDSLLGVRYPHELLRTFRVPGQRGPREI